MNLPCTQQDQPIPLQDSSIDCLILDKLSLPVLVINRDHSIAYANPAAQAEFVPSKGVFCYRILMGNDDPCESSERGCVLTKLWSDGGSTQTVHEVKLADGTIKLSAISASPVLGDNGLPIQAIVTFQDLTDYIYLEHCLYNVLNGIANSIGKQFLLDIAEQLSINTRMEHVLIGRYYPEQRVVQSLAFFSQDKLVAPVRYEVAGAPCEHTVRGLPMVVENDVHTQFPEDEFIARSGIQSYYGVPLRDSQDNVTGIIAAFSQRKLDDKELVGAILNAFAARAAGELERVEIESALLRTQASLEHEIERRTAALQESQERYRWLFDSSSDAMAVIDLEEEESGGFKLGRVLMVNQTAVRISGFSRTELLKMSPYDFTPPNSDQMMKGLEKELLIRKNVQFDTEVVIRSGHRFPMEFHLQMLELDSRPVVLATGRDISKRLAAENALRKSEERFRSIVENTPVGMCISDALGNFEYCNASFCQTFGYTEAELLGQHLTITAHPNHREAMQAAHFNVIHGDGEFRGEMAVQRKDSTPLVVLMDAMRITGLDGAPREVAFILDITASKRSQELEKQMALLAELSPEPIIRFDRDGKVLLANSASTIVFQQSATPGQDLCALIPELLEFDFATCINQALLQDLAFQRGQRNYRASLRGVPELGFGQLSVTDITAMVAAQHQAEAASIAKSQFLANMSHELRTPLSAINGFSEILLEQAFGPLTQTQREYLERINQSGQHLLSLISDLLDLAKIEAGKLELVKENVDLRLICIEACELLGERVKQQNLTLIRNLPDEPAPYRGDPLRLRQVLINLLSNAVKFTHQGTITVSLEIRETLYVLSVEDTGIGIAEDKLHLLFHRFEQVHDRSKVSEVGTGLGLALCREIVTAHGGVISVESSTDVGSKFIATLPFEKRM